MKEFKDVVLVTGGAGFVGSNLAKRLEIEHPKATVVVLDNFSSGSWQNLVGFSGDVIPCQLGDRKECEWILDQLVGRYKIDCVFHNASITDTEVHDQSLMLLSNVESLRNVAVVCDSSKCPLVTASSSAVYGQHPVKPMKVGEHENPLNVYGYSKLLADNLVRRLIKSNFPIVSLRYFNIYGPGEHRKGKTASMIYKIYRQLNGLDSDIVRTDNKAQVTLFKGSDEFKRDWIHVDDIVTANLAAVNAKPGIYNVGTGQPSTFVELTQWIGDAIGGSEREVKFRWVKNKAPEFYQKYTRAAIKKTKIALEGFKPIATKDGIKKYVKHLGEVGL